MEKKNVESETIPLEVKNLKNIIRCDRIHQKDGTEGRR